MKIKAFFAAIAALMSLVSCQNTPTVTDSPKKILVVVDVQRDFFDPAGSLYVSGSEALPSLIAEAVPNYDAVIFTLDWHPGNHCSFSKEGGIWPSHCVQYTQGAGLADEFSAFLSDGTKHSIFLKGMDKNMEEYGAFADLGNCPEIASWFANCESVAVCGIAGDYCVKESTANILKYVPAEKVTVLTDLTRSIDGGAALEAFITENGLNN